MSYRKIKPSRFFYRKNHIIYFKERINEHMMTQTEQEKLTDMKKYNYFEVFSGYDDDELGLIDFIQDFRECCKALTESKILKIHYKKYFDHRSAVILTFKRLSPLKLDTNVIDNIEIDNIPFEEFYNNELCKKGSILFLDETYKGKEVQCYGYDYSSFYPYILGGSDLKIPLKKPTFHKLASLDYDSLQYGIYHVKITTKDPSFLKKFRFSKNDRYTHYCLSYAYKNKDKYGLEFQLMDSENNAALYDESCLIDSKTVFGRWYEVIVLGLKKENKNMLTKHLSSSLWGYLFENKKLNLTNREVEELPEGTISQKNDPSPTEYKIIKERLVYENDIPVSNFTVVKKDEAYKYNIARMKVFMLSYSRCFIGKMIDDEQIEDSVIRIHTDGIVLNKPHTFKSAYSSISEDKTTGSIIFKNVNVYYKQ